MMHQHGTIKAFNNLASLYEERFMDVSKYERELNLFCSLLKIKHPKVFEIACGPGNITKYLFDRIDGLELYGIDLAPEMIRLATKNNPKGKFSVMDCRQLKNEPGFYDGVMCSFVMPYLNLEESKSLINESFRLLNQHGIFLFSTQEADPAKSGFEFSSNGTERAMVYYHLGDELIRIAEEAGFIISDIARYPENKSQVGNYNELFIICQKQ